MPLMPGICISEATTSKAVCRSSFSAVFPSGASVVCHWSRSPAKHHAVKLQQHFVVFNEQDLFHSVAVQNRGKRLAMQFQCAVDLSELQFRLQFPLRQGIFLLCLSPVLTKD